MPRNRLQESVASKIESSILPGGIIWSDHGGNSQDLVIITTRSVLCYKISHKRKQMSATHFFHHPMACAMWWEPTSRTIVVGSYVEINESHPFPDRILQLQTTMLWFPRNKRNRLPRLELPPPHRLEPFVVGGWRGPSLSSRNQQIATSDMGGSRITPQQLVLVNLYGDAYIVEIGVERHFQIRFYYLDRSSSGKPVKQCVSDLYNNDDEWSWVLR